MKGLFLGRFQPFHKGHLHIIKKALEEVDELIIIIGSSQYSNTADNPFSTEEREKMIKVALDSEGIVNYEIIPIPDIHSDDEYVDHVKTFTPEFEIVFASDNNLTEKLFSEKGYKVVVDERFMGINATKIREMMIKGENWQELIPAETVKVIEKINGVERIKKLL
ncbi:nicotinamide-nucleotide adenylyltransferase [Candidatus Woesearchaeota archaeon]|nr:nicotinamide-nucleotide adenylyltransferase [Candidatus Woesearchaeota archaeon]